MLVPKEEAPQEEDLDGDAMIEDEGSFHSDAGVSSTVVSPEPILILAPVRASVHYQKCHDQILGKLSLPIFAKTFVTFFISQR